MKQRPDFAASFFPAAMPLIAGFLVLCLSACGFSPLYGTRDHNALWGTAAPQEQLANIYIENIPNREGQYLRNALIDRFYQNGTPAAPRYRLIISGLNETITNLDIRKSADATRAQLQQSAKLALQDRHSQETIFSRQITAITSYNILRSNFTSKVSEENARRNGLDDLARQIETHLSLYFNNRS